MPTVALILALAVLGGVVLAFVMHRMGQTLAGRRKSAVLRAAMYAGIALLLMMQPGPMLGLGLLFAGLAGAELLALLRETSDLDARREFKRDPSHCGRCGYDRYGVDRPTCPECGWRFPAEDAPVERRDWPMWWKYGWRIDHLEHWRRTLMSLVLVMAMFLLLGGYMMAQGSTVAAVVCGVMLLMQGISLVRVIQYARDRPRPAA